MENKKRGSHKTAPSPLQITPPTHPQEDCACDGSQLTLAAFGESASNATSHQPATQDHFRRAGHRPRTAGAGVEEMNESPLGFIYLQPADCATDGNAGPEAASGWGQDAVSKHTADYTPSASTQPDKGVSSIIYPLLFPDHDSTNTIIPPSPALPDLSDAEITPDYGLENGIYRYLASGIDSMYLSLYVEWDERWPKIERELSRHKHQAEQSNTHTVLVQTSDKTLCAVWDKGKQPTYRYHLETQYAHFWLTASGLLCNVPNIYLSLRSELIWKHGIWPLYHAVESFVKNLGGRIQRHQISRLDLCNDFYLPGGISEEFLKAYTVCSSRKVRKEVNNDKLETYYCGKKSAPLFIRIYNKTEDSLKKNKLWFFDLWGVCPSTEVWRFEYQVRREVLKQFGIETLDDLSMLGGFWNYLTSWYSLRLNDNKKSDRRTTHPFWQQVALSAEHFGQTEPIQRMRARSSILSSQTYANRLMSNLATLAVLEGETSLEGISRKLLGMLKLRNLELQDDGQPDFLQMVQKKSLEIEQRERLSAGDRVLLYEDCPEDLL